MRAFSFLTIAALLLASFFLVTPIEAKAQIYCQPTSIKQIFPGGVIVDRMCNNRQIAGMGSTVDAANANLSNFMTLFPTKACRSSNSSPVWQFPGGFRVSFQCTDIYGAGYHVSGVGSTVTDASQNAFTFGQLYTALDDVACHVQNYDISAFVGGFKVNTNCLKVGYPTQAIVSGIGSTASDAGKNARGFAELVASDTICLLTGNVTGGAGYFTATWYCNGYPVTGYGGTVTAVGNDALAQASML